MRRTLLVVCAAIFSGCGEPSSGTETVEGLPADPAAYPSHGTDAVAGSVGKCVYAELYPGKTVCILDEPQMSPLELSAPTFVPELGTNIYYDRMGVSWEQQRIAAADKLKPSVDHQRDYLDAKCPTIHDQGQCGWCVAHATTAFMEAARCANGEPEQRISEPDLWTRGGADLSDCDGGWYIHTAFATTGKFFLSPTTVWSYNQSVVIMQRERPAAEVLDKSGILGTGSINVLVASDVMSLKSALSEGHNVVLNVPVYGIKLSDKIMLGQSGWNTGKIVSCSICWVRGWHAVLVVGYDDASETFTFKNSWGADWGDRGYGTFTYEFITKDTDHEGTRGQGFYARELRIRNQTPPNTQIDSGPSGTIRTNGATFGFSGSDNGGALSHFECMLAPGTSKPLLPWGQCSSPKEYSALADGSYTFWVQAVDIDYNTDPTPASRAFVVDTSVPDTTPPQTTISAGPTGIITSNGVTIQFACNEGACTYECRLNGGPWSACTSPKSYGALSDSVYTFEVRARDAALNVDASPASRSWTIDTTVPDNTPPATTIDSGPPSTTDSPDAVLGFSCSEGTCTYECRLNSGAWSSCSSPKSYLSLADGPYSFDVRAMDAAMNVDASPANHVWTVNTVVPDTTPPDTTIDSGPVTGTTSQDATFSFSCSEETCTYECKLNAGSWATCTSPKIYSALTVATHTFYVRARDAELNVDASPVSRTWTILHPWASIPAGCFNMGDEADGIPVRIVCITQFDMTTREITNGEYQACVAASGCTAPWNTDSATRSPYYGDATYADYPVGSVSYSQATAYCAWVGGRLPTEAEWEYAARGGLSDKRFPWGDTITCAQANYLTDETYAYDVDPYVGAKWCVGDTTAVGSYAANGYGLYDMAGNVYEWVSDWSDYAYYTGRPIPDNDPTGPTTGTSRRIRGGDYRERSYAARVANRNSGVTPASYFAWLGFRCVR